MKEKDKDKEVSYSRIGKILLTAQIMLGLVRSIFQICRMFFHASFSQAEKISLGLRTCTIIIVSVTLFLVCCMENMEKQGEKAEEE